MSHGPTRGAERGGLAVLACLLAVMSGSSRGPCLTQLRGRGKREPLTEPADGNETPAARLPTRGTRRERGRYEGREYDDGVDARYAVLTCLLACPPVLMERRTVGRMRR